MNGQPTIESEPGSQPNAIPVFSENDIPQSSILAQMERILASAAFSQSARMCRFLRMVVEYSLGNRAGELKEYPIALQVFDRKPSFDPRLDPIVRVEARRLRTKLGHYYEREGTDDDIRIELPKGNYCVRFSRREACGPVAADVAPGSRLNPPLQSSPSRTSVPARRTTTSATGSRRS